MYKNMPDFNRALRPHHTLFHTMDQVYVFSNENVSDCLDQLGDMRGKRVLSVCASGDHAFECYARGASRVDTFDINYTQKNMMELKLHMIRNLPYEEFLEYFFGCSRRMSSDIITPLWDLFSDSLKIFYSQVYSSKNVYHIGPMISANLTSPFRNVGNISYIQDYTVYERLARTLPEKIKFTHTDLETLPSVISGKYDIILLSNIFDYMYTTLNQNELALAKLYDNVLAPMSKNNLNNETGTIVFDYMWGRRALERIHLLEDYFYWANKFNAKHRDKQMGYLTFNAAWDTTKQDCALLLRCNGR